MSERVSQPQLRLALVQGDTLWHDPEGNRAHYAKLLEPQRGQADLIVLPETFTSGFSNEFLSRAESEGGPTLEWLHEQAQRTGAAITGSVQVRDGDQVFNRMYFVTPAGDVSRYDKRHLFRFAKEHERYAAGKDRVIVEYKGWRILLQVCYDLRFPVFSRNAPDAQGEAAFDLMLYVANWPAVRSYPWIQLAKARAIENLAYVASVNRAGTDGNGLEYSGDSAIYDFKGKVLAECRDAAEQVVFGSVSMAELQAFRAQFPALLDADAFEITDR